MHLSRAGLAAALAIGLVTFLSPTSRTVATETLASANFNGDAIAETAHPGTPGVSEEIYDDSDCEGGSSAVAGTEGVRYYRLTDLGTEGGRRGLRAPLSATVSSGSMQASAVIVAEQTGNGGTLTLNNPNDNDWIGMVAFDSYGHFQVHGSPTAATYTTGHRYLVEMDFAFGPGGHVDYTITDLSTSTEVLYSTGSSVAIDAEADALTYSTGQEDDGAYTIDDILVTR